MVEITDDEYRMRRIVIDNFLPDSVFHAFKWYVQGAYMPWYKNDGIDDYNDGKYQFTHSWFRNNDWNSDPQNIIPIINYVHPLAIARIKVNMMPPMPKVEENNFHIDLPNLTTMVLYVNTNDGYTLFKDGFKVNSLENRAIIFDSNLEHTGTTSTDWRYVLNMNYVENAEKPWSLGYKGETKVGEGN